MATSDVVIIGGGINGVAIAHALARRGVDVTVIERNSIASGPTGRSCGIIRQHYSHEVTARLALESLAIFENFEEEVGGACDFRQTGFIMAVGPEREAALRRNVRLQQRVGIDTQLISVQEVQEMVPGVNTAGIALAAYEPRSGYADAHTTSMSYAESARRLGADIRTGVEVSRLRIESGRIAGVETTSGGRFDADNVVIAAGPWSPGLARLCGLEVPIRPHRVQIGVFEAAPGHTPQHIFVDTCLGMYHRPESGAMMLVGSVETAEADGTIAGPDDYATAADPERMETYVERLLQRIPPMRDGRFRSGYASLYDVTPDWQPIVDAVPGTEGLFCVAGSSGHGFKLAPAIAEMAADLITCAATAEPLFAFARFASAVVASGSYPEHSILG